MENGNGSPAFPLARIPLAALFELAGAAVAVAAAAAAAAIRPIGRGRKHLRLAQTSARSFITNKGR